MRINNISNNMYIYNKTNKEKITIKENNVENLNYDLKISDKASEFQFAMKKVKETSEMRMDKVNDIKERINSGYYEVSAKSIAEKMMADVSAQRIF